MTCLLVVLVPLTVRLVLEVQMGEKVWPIVVVGPIAAPVDCTRGKAGLHIQSRSELRPRAKHQDVLLLLGLLALVGQLFVFLGSEGGERSFRGRIAARTISNSSSRSSYSRFSSSSSKPGANADQLSSTVVCQMLTMPAEVTEAMHVRPALHCAAVSAGREGRGIRPHIAVIERVLGALEHLDERPASAVPDVDVVRLLGPGAWHGKRSDAGGLCCVNIRTSNHVLAVPAEADRIPRRPIDRVLETVQRLGKCAGLLGCPRVDLEDAHGPVRRVGHEVPAPREVSSASSTQCVVPPACPIECELLEGTMGRLETVNDLRSGGSVEMGTPMAADEPAAWPRRSSTASPRSSRRR